MLARSEWMTTFNGEPIVGKSMPKLEVSIENSLK
jgi:hypothetical protein